MKRECGPTHHHACQCREEYFAKLEANLTLAGAFIAKLTNETHTVTGTACREDGDVLEWTEQQPTLLATEARALLAELSPVRGR